MPFETPAPPALSEGESNASPRRRDWAAGALGDASRAALAEDAELFLHQSVSTPCLSVIVKAEGPWIEDAEGRRYLDFHGNNVHHIGYGHPLKLARAATGRFKTVSFWDAFHGAGFGASSVGGEQLFRSNLVGPLLAGTEHVAPFACYRCPYGYPETDGQPNLDLCRMTCANMVRYVLEKEGDVAAVIAEPARAVPYVPPPGFWAAVRQACDDMGALLIFDEIPTVMGKGLGGGILPIAAVIARPGLDVAGDYAFGHYTHEKNPVTTRAGLTTIEIIEDENLVENAATLGAYALDRLHDMKGRLDVVGDVRGRGFLMGVELVMDRAGKEPAVALAEDVLYRCLDGGLSFKISMGNTLTLTPPLVVTRDQMDLALDVLKAAIADAARAAGLA